MSELRSVAVFGSAAPLPGSEEYRRAEWVGRSLAERGLAVVTGGYGGVMEAASKGAAEAGGHVTGVTAPSEFPDRVGANRYVAEEIAAAGLTARIGTMMDMAAGAVALPGSIGTATELLIAWNRNHIIRERGDRTVPVVAVGAAWRRLAEVLVFDAGAFAGDVHLAPSAEEALPWLLNHLP